MSSHHHPDSREHKFENTRYCEICNEKVDCGIDGMLAHISANHDMEALAEAISHPWTPNEPLTFRHTTGTAHFLESFGGKTITTLCGNTFLKPEVAPDETMDEWNARTSYDQYDKDAYCGSCVSLQKRHHFGPLPDALED